MRSIVLQWGARSGNVPGSNAPRFCIHRVLYTPVAYLGTPCTLLITTSRLHGLWLYVLPAHDGRHRAAARVAKGLPWGLTRELRKPVVRLVGRSTFDSQWTKFAIKATGISHIRRGTRFLPIRHPRRRRGKGRESDLGKFRLLSASNDDEPINPRTWALHLRFD